jgi:hypothetical protein
MDSLVLLLTPENIQLCIPVTQYYAHDDNDEQSAHLNPKCLFRRL